MATYTTNINLKKPAQSDKIRIADFNGNADNIDAAFGADFGQSSKPSVNASINNLADGLAIVAQGNVHAAISAGQFVYVRGHGTLGEGLYVANQAISANGTLSSSNLDADTSGGLNALNSKLTDRVKSVGTPNITSTESTYTISDISSYTLLVVTYYQNNVGPIGTITVPVNIFKQGNAIVIYPYNPNSAETATIQYVNDTSIKGKATTSGNKYLSIVAM